MKALVKAAARPGFELKDVPEPTIRDDEVLIRVRRAGVCGTDVHIYDWDAWAQGRVKPPIVVGHEFAGEVVQVGTSRHRRARGRPRDGRGPHRRRTLPAVPHRATRTSVRTRRSSASIATAASPSTSRCPRRTSGISTTTSRSTSAAFTIRWATRFTRRSRAEIPGATVLVTGCGPIGIFAVGICKAAGASRIIASRRERDAARAREADGRARRRASRAKRKPSSSSTPTDSASTSCSRCPASRPRFTRRSRSCASAGACRCSAFRRSRWTSISRPRSSSRDSRSTASSAAGCTTRGIQMTRFLRSGQFDPTPVITHRFPLDGRRRGDSRDQVGRGRQGHLRDRVTTETYVTLNDEFDARSLERHDRAAQGATRSTSGSTISTRRSRRA